MREDSGVGRKGRTGFKFCGGLCAKKVTVASGQQSVVTVQTVTARRCFEICDCGLRLDQPAAAPHNKESENRVDGPSMVLLVDEMHPKKNNASVSLVFREQIDWAMMDGCRQESRLPGCQESRVKTRCLGNGALQPSLSRIAAPSLIHSAGGPSFCRELGLWSHRSPSTNHRMCDAHF